MNAVSGMDVDRFRVARELSEEFGRLEAALAVADGEDMQQSRTRYGQIKSVALAYLSWRRAGDELSEAGAVCESGAGFTDEVARLVIVRVACERDLERALSAEVKLESEGVIIEIKAGTGGDEAARFAGDMARMYQLYAEKYGWVVKIVDATAGASGGYKDICMSIDPRAAVLAGASPGQRLMFEGGVHRVQRVPSTESRGRVHTSTVGVVVLAQAAEADLEIKMSELRIDVFRSSGPGGQSVNTTDSAVRITHIPTGTVAICQNEKSQLRNKEAAMRLLRARLLAAAAAAAGDKIQELRRSQVQGAKRSERIRSYNFAERRVTDHRIGYKVNNLESVLNGDLDPIVERLLNAKRADSVG